MTTPFRRGWLPGERETICSWVPQRGDAALLNAVGRVGAMAPEHDLDVQVRALDDLIYACDALSSERRAAWSRWFIAWDAPYSNGMLAGQVERLQRVARELEAWRAELLHACPSDEAGASTASLAWLGVGAIVLAGLAWYVTSRSSVPAARARLV